MEGKSPIRSTNVMQRLMRSPLGNMVARSWMDERILYSLEHWFFPVSRLWAAARRANGDVDRFFEAVPMTPVEDKRDSLSDALKLFENKRQQILATEFEWREAFFDRSRTVTDQALLALESQRLRHRDEYNATRKKFFSMRGLIQSSVYSDCATQEQMQAEYGLDRLAFRARFAPPEHMPEVEVSHSIPTATHRDYWIRFASPSKRLNDIVYARVLDPIGIKNPPTLIFGHGIGVEFDHWRNLVDVADLLPQLGIRVIRPEAPWHGRRVPDGYYGGEYFLSSAPIGAFDFFTAQHQEWAVLTDWARQTSAGPVGFGGSSLGAQSAQTTSIRAQHWPKHFQPDALFLMTHCAHLWEVALDGDLADIWGLHEPLHELGWNRQKIEQWLLKLDPEGVPCVPADNVVSVLGKDDRVTPFRSGKRLQELWELPKKNCFTFPCGHFTVPLRTARDHRPLLRLQEIFNGLTS